MENVTSDTGRAFAPFTGLIFSAFYVLLVIAFFAAAKGVQQIVAKSRANRL